MKTTPGGFEYEYPMDGNTNFTATLPAVGGARVTSASNGITSPAPPPMIGRSSAGRELYAHICDTLRQASGEHLQAGKTTSSLFFLHAFTEGHAMNQIQNHLNHMLNGDQTIVSHATEALLAELASVNLDSRALERLGRHVLAAISADLKSGIHAQKAMTAAMGNRHD